MSGFEDSSSDWARTGAPSFTGDLLDAGRILAEIWQHLIQGDLEQAVVRYESCSQDVGDQLEAGFQRSPRPVQERLANLFFRARDYGRAAACCEVIGEWNAAARAHAAAFQFSEAAECYLKAGDTRQAAMEFQKAGHHERAAEIFLERNEPVGAAQAYEGAGDFLVAAQLYAQAGEPHRAANVLARVPPTDLSYGEALSRLADLLLGLGRTDLALQRLSVALPRDRVVREPSEARIAHRYALLLQGEARHDEALGVLRMLAAYDPDFFDVRERLRALGVELPPPQLGAAPLVGVPRAIRASETPTDLGRAASLTGPPSLTPTPTPSRKSSLSPLAPNALVANMPGYELMKSLPLFSDLSLDEMRDFYHLADQCHFEPGQVLIEQGRPGAGLFVLREGEVEILHYQQGTVERLGTLGAGEHVGEMALIDAAPTSARVAARTPVKALFFARDRFEGYLAMHDRVALRIYRKFAHNLAERLRDANTRGGGPVSPAPGK